MNVRSKPRLGALSLALAAFFWGIAFVAQSDAATKISAPAFLFYRFLIGAIVLLPVIAVIDCKNGLKTGFFRRFCDKTLLFSGAICGLLLFSASVLQQLAFSFGTTSGKCGFLTAMYMIFVPILCLFLGKKTTPLVWVCVGVSLVGMYLLCIAGAPSVAPGDGLALLCAVLYAAHILVVDHFVSKVDPIRLSCLQFFVSSLLGGLVALFTGFPSLPVVLSAAVSILYVGIFSSGVGYTLQIVGQKTCPPAIAPVIMSLESVFAALSGFVLGVEQLTIPQIVGCVLIFAACLVLQLPRKIVFSQFPS